MQDELMHVRNKTSLFSTWWYITATKIIWSSPFQALVGTDMNTLAQFAETLINLGKFCFMSIVVRWAAQLLVMTHPQIMS